MRSYESTLARMVRIAFAKGQILRSSQLMNMDDALAVSREQVLALDEQRRHRRLVRLDFVNRLDVLLRQIPHFDRLVAAGREQAVAVRHQCNDPVGVLAAADLAARVFRIVRAVRPRSNGAVLRRRKNRVVVHHNVVNDAGVNKRKRIEALERAQIPHFGNLPQRVGQAPRATQQRTRTMSHEPEKRRPPS